MFLIALYSVHSRFSALSIQYLCRQKNKTQLNCKPKALVFTLSYLVPCCTPLQCNSKLLALSYCTVSCTLLQPTEMRSRAICLSCCLVVSYTVTPSYLRCLTVQYLVPCCTPLQCNPKLLALSCSIFYPAAPHCKATPSFLRCPAVSCTLLHPTAKQPQAVCAVYCTVSCTMMHPTAKQPQAFCAVRQYIVPCCILLQCAVLCYSWQYSTTLLKGTVSRDFRLLVFFMKQFPPSPWAYH